jgi:hypothetical protein
MHLDVGARWKWPANTALDAVRRGCGRRFVVLHSGIGDEAVFAPGAFDTPVISLTLLGVGSKL